MWNVGSIPDGMCLFSVSPTVPRGSPVSVYLFPGEARKLLPPSVPKEGEESELDGLVATATEVDRKSVV